MGGKKTEACGRCGVSSVVDTTEDPEHELFGEERIEVDDSELRSVLGVQRAAGRMKRRLDAFASRLTYGR